jgi:hypothetical protein
MIVPPKTWQLGILTLGVAAIFGCDRGKSVMEIGQIKQNDRGSIVYIQGKVRSQAPFLGSTAYQLEDRTGKIWILSDRAIPTQGAEILVEGKVEYESILLGQQDFGELYILELKQLKSEPSTQKNRLDRQQAAVIEKSKVMTD